MKKPKSQKSTVLNLGGMKITIAPPPPPAPPAVFSPEANAIVDAFRAECEASPDRRVVCVDFLAAEQRLVLRGRRAGQPQFDFRIQCRPTERSDPLMAKHLARAMDYSAEDLMGIVDELLHGTASAVGVKRLAERFTDHCDAARISWDFDERVRARTRR